MSSIGLFLSARPRGRGTLSCFRGCGRGHVRTLGRCTRMCKPLAMSAIDRGDSY